MSTRNGYRCPKCGAKWERVEVRNKSGGTDTAWRPTCECKALPPVVDAQRK